MGIELIILLASAIIGIGSFIVSGRCRGRNAKQAFTYSGWGGLLLLLWFVPISLFPFPLGFLNLLLSVTPSAICFLLAANSMLKEMRAQKVGDYTDAA